jgi:hypothetical protein
MDRQQLLERYRTGADAAAAALDGLTDAQLDATPGDGGWSPRMVAHHLADSETNSFIRLRRLVAEEEPFIAGYDEELWAARLHYDRPIGTSMAVLRAVRAASLELLERLGHAEWERAGRHGELGRYGIADWLRIYAEHPHEHAEQIRRAAGAA